MGLYVQSPPLVLLFPLSRLWSESELRSARHVKNDELRFEENVPVNREPNAGVSLDTSKASWTPLAFENRAFRTRALTAASCWSIVDVRARDNCLVASNAKGDAW